MPDREFAELAESIKRMEARFEEFAAKMLAAQKRMIQALEQMCKDRNVVVHNVSYAEGVRFSAVELSAQANRAVARAMQRSVDAVGGAGCKAAVETLRP
jgi:hypothetical protein